MEMAEGRKDDEPYIPSMDRISQLPHPMLQHILSFLSQTEAVQTSALSKPWRHHWSTRPNIEFRETLFRGTNDSFMSVLDRTLRSYHRQNLSIKHFLVEISSVAFESKLLFEKWIPLLLMNMGVEALHLVFPESSRFVVPPVVFQAEFLKELYLGECTINSTGNDKITLKHLQTLSLNQVCTADEALDKIIASCPLIQRVDLYGCKGVKTVKVNNLKHFGCWFSSSSIEIELPSALETIRIMRCGNWHHNSKHPFPRLKSLYLNGVGLFPGFFNSFSCYFPCLEDLELGRCTGFKEVKLLSRSVKNLVIVDTTNIKTITVSAPSILYFEFSGGSSLPSISFTTAASREWVSIICIPFKLRCSNSDALPWFLKLREMLKALTQSRITLNLLYDPVTNQHIKNTDHVGYYEPVVVEHLSLREIVSTDYFAAVFNCLFRIFRPKYIDMDLYVKQKRNNNKLVEFMCKKIDLKDGEFSRCYFWQRELEELSIQILDDCSKKWCPVQGSSIPVCAWPKTEATQNIRFAFEWRESTFLLDS